MAKKREFPKIQTDFGQRTRVLREAQGLTRDELGELADLSPQNIAKIENGERFVTAESLGRLSVALGVEPSYFFDGSPGVHQKSPIRRKIDLLLQNRSENHLKLILDVSARILKEI